MIEAFGASDPGCVRNNNEDYYLVAPSLGLYLVADGMGGAQAGEHASKLAAETVWEVVYKSAGAAGAETLINAFEEANRRVMDAASADPEMEGMGTTLVAALETGGDLIIASVGDSTDAARLDHGDRRFGAVACAHLPAQASACHTSTALQRRLAWCRARRGLEDRAVFQSDPRSQVPATHRCGAIAWGTG